MTAEREQVEKQASWINEMTENCGQYRKFEPEKMHALLQPKGHYIVHDTLNKVNESGVTPEHGRERCCDDVVTAEQYILARQQQPCLFPFNISDANSVRY